MELLKIKIDNRTTLGQNKITGKMLKNEGATKLHSKSWSCSSTSIENSPCMDMGNSSFSIKVRPS